MNLRIAKFMLARGRVSIPARVTLRGVSVHGNRGSARLWSGSHPTYSGVREVAGQRSEPRTFTLATMATRGQPIDLYHDLCGEGRFLPSRYLRAGGGGASISEREAPVERTGFNIPVPQY